MNDVCQIKESTALSIIFWILFTFSVFVYLIAFLVLFTKCPASFKGFRDYLVAHITVGLFLDFHTRLTWNLKIIFPSASICSNGLFSEYSIISFQIFIVLLGITGITTVNLFVYRMNAVAHDMKRLPFRKLVIYLNYSFYVGKVFVDLFGFLTYSELRDQHDYKKIIEQKKGALPDFVWCDSCFFLRFDSFLTLTFFILAYISLTLSFIAGLLAAVETFRSLKMKDLKLSVRTASVQRNLTFSLVVLCSVHTCMIFIPLALFFIANFIVIYDQTLPIIATIMIQDHGSFSTFAMILTNNLLRKSAKELFNRCLSGKTPEQESGLNQGNLFHLQ